MIVGIIATVMGVGGAFLLVPAMIYLIGMPTKLVPGTSLFVTIFITICCYWTCIQIPDY